MQTDTQFWKIAGDGTVLWGTAQSSSYAGYVQSVNENISTDTAQCRDAVGVVVQECMYNPNQDATLTLVLNSTSIDPKVGDTAISISDGGIQTIGHVVAQTLQSSNTSFKTWQFTVRAYTGCSETVPATNI